VLPAPFNFECIVCGICCQWGGWVCLYPEDVPRLADFFHLTPQETADRYTRHIAAEFANDQSVSIVPYLALKNVGDRCIFLEADGRCAVHPAKPIHCAESPLLAEFLLDKEGWKAFSGLCPGLGRGPLVSARAMRAAMRRQSKRDLQYEADLAACDWSLARLLNLVLPEPELIPDLGLELDESAEA